MCNNIFENMRSQDIQIPKCEWPQGYQKTKGKGVGLGAWAEGWDKGKGVKGWGAGLGQGGGARAWVGGCTS